ncbi:MAG: AI-2E family transporter [Alphaproteobacteria bacterium]|nr:AI-2E family transporter [Alphaproteobacteria bacterium]
MTPAQNARFWLIALVVFILVVWALSPMLLPFVAALAIAYFLNPAVNALGRFNMGRGFAALIILLAFTLLVVLVSALVLPLINAQLVELVGAIPGYATRIRNHFQPLINEWLAHLSPHDLQKIEGAMTQYAGDVVSWVGAVLRHVLSGGMAIFDLLMLLVVTPVVAFYLMRDWPHFVAAVDDIIPRGQHDMIVVELQNIDNTLAGFVRGQALVCMFLGTFYAVGLSLTGLDYGAVVGITAGVLSFIPYVGTTFGWVISLILALLQFEGAWPVFSVLMVFVVGQVIEGYFLTPKLVGDRVGLHPVWIMFAIFAGGALLGFVGVLIAVPLAAVLGVVLRFLVRQYKASPYYYLKKT